MAQTDIPWYEIVEGTTGRARMKLVKSRYYASAVSAEELGDVEIECVVPIVKMSYILHDRSGNQVKTGEYSFPGAGVNAFTLREVLPLAQLKAYETDTADYGIDTQVTLASGDVVGGYFTFQGWLHTGTTADEVPEKNYRDRLAGIPVAKPGMTEMQLRQICLDLMRLEVEAPFKLEKDFTYPIKSQHRDRTLLGGKVYGGLPYVSRGAGNPYRIAAIYDPATGTLDANSDIFADARYIGNACSGATAIAWSRVVTSAFLAYDSKFMTMANGYLPVGPYRYSKDDATMFANKDPNGCNCRSICDENGAQVMFESYAQMKIADGIVTAGHVRMNSAVPVVIRNPDGTIDGDKSYALMHEQVCYTGSPSHIRMAPDGTHYVVQGGVDIRYSFRNLFDTGYIPFTFAEFRDPSRVERAKVRLTVDPELKNRYLSCNYPISDLFAELDGKRFVFHSMEIWRKEAKLGDVFPEEFLKKDTRFFCQLYNGQLLEISTAK